MLVDAKLQKAKVAIAGLGGLGSHIALSLGRLGVGSLLLVDDDVVDSSNLSRQNYDVRHLGLPKSQALQSQLEMISAFVRVEARRVRVTEDNVAELFGGYDVLCEAFDREEEKAMLVSAALTQLPHLKVVAASGVAGYGSANQIHTVRRMKNLYICGDHESSLDLGAGLMAPRVQICAGHQANMVVRLLLGIEEA